MVDHPAVPVVLEVLVVSGERGLLAEVREPRGVLVEGVLMAVLEAVGEHLGAE